MHIRSLTIKNFRLLTDVTLTLEKGATVIVGRNNSGKTSLTELFRRLLLEKSPVFRLEDFSCAVHEQFWNAFIAFNGGMEEEEVRDLLPKIQLRIAVDYSDNPSSFGTLAEFIVDLNADCHETLIDVSYELMPGKMESLYAGFEVGTAPDLSVRQADLFKALRNRIPGCFRRTLAAVDPNDATNSRTLEWSNLHALLHSGFINAQRWIDDTTHKDNDVLGNILEALFKAARADSADENDRGTAESLESAVLGMQETLDKEFNKNIKALVPALTLFGYPGLNDPGLRTETTLDVQRLLTNHTKVRYEGAFGVSLPEAYNGLGTRNLIFILLQLLEFFKAFKARTPAPGVHLVFIEEPEAHLHPQMAEVFIRKLTEIAGTFATQFNNGNAWPVQFVVSTHSSHMANEASFESIRYFLATTDDKAPHLRRTRVKDLRQGLSGTPATTRNFLHQYLTLTRCDLFFADKAALIEGCAERLLLPRMIEKADTANLVGKKLSQQYVSIVEVCGAYAHKFFDLVEFLEIPTLIITDLDSVKKSENNRWIACPVSEGTRTSNGCLKEWFAQSEISPVELISKPDGVKIKGRVRLAYQVPETVGGACGRSFEDAFMLANVEMFDFPNDGVDPAAVAWAKAADERKSEFALSHALDVNTWAVPRYIADGIRWLANQPVVISEAANVEATAQTSVAPNEVAGV